MKMLEGMRVLVLGAGGFVGSAICRELRKQGAIVQGFGRNITYGDSIEDEILWTNGNLSDDMALSKAIVGQNIVFHLINSSLPESSNHNPASDLSANTLPTLSLLELCKNEGVKKIVFASSGGAVYGIPEKTPIPENAQTDPISAYGISKLSIEKYLNLYYRLYGLNYHIFRVANPYGPYQSPFRKQGVIAVTMHRILNNLPIEIYGNDKIVRDYVYVDDVARLLVSGIEYNGEHRVMNVGSGIGLSIDDVITQIEKTLRVSKQSRNYRSYRAADVPISILDISLAKHEMNWSPQVSLADGLARTANWMKSSFSKN
ncbi:NAD-dependent epimerase/dehydratase family protein [Methylobacterium sp. Leaf88]|uniref:NAD-dependent epimerase/dehydratase family protein n=1 Tax=Methylobacterium sp. Leaf88 TaxID=1736244 RepID=UPI00138F8070|nr:NAD-dependent epimerase/dehydratase family protein [Methylobacterium sp. Leaf88]